MRILTLITLAFAVATTSATEQKPWDFPIERRLPTAQLILHAPQIVSWENYSKANLLMAAEAYPDKGGETIYATIEVSGVTKVNLDERIVTLSTPIVEKVIVLNKEEASYREILQSSIKKNSLDIPLDIFLLSLANDVLEVDNEDGFNLEPPVMMVKHEPTMLLYINGDPVFSDMPPTDYKVVTNANWPLIRDESSGVYLLLSKRTWLASQELVGPWMTTESAPADIDKLDPEGPYASFRVSEQKISDIPAMTLVTEPTELIVIDGEPTLEEIPGTDGLNFVSNSGSPVFELDQRWYFLTAGRWFTTKKLNDKDWTLVSTLPDAFSQIPEDHGMAYVRSSIAGTIEARTAILEATIPREKTVEADQPLTIEQKFDGEPQFESITGTKVSRAVNTTHDIILYQNVYYLCYDAAWYQADAPIGPWIAAFRVPPEVYEIPPSSASYHVTQVEVVSSSPTTVTYNYTQGYSSGIYVAYGIPVYGTGWYYPRYYGYYGWHYPHYYSYGYGSFYNPRTGNYGTRSTWYGPYGGYSYNQHTSPRSGRSGYVETAWDNDEWASYGETYNPRTQVYTETSRYFSEDTDRFEMEREIARGNNRIITEREVDLDDGWAKSTRNSSKGGSAYIESHRQADGSITSSGTIRASDGRTADLSQEISDGKRRTELTGSEGGQLVSGGDGRHRGFVGEGAEGDLYAGNNGNVYKKTDDGWHQYDRDSGDWQQMGGRLDDADKQAAQERFGNRETQTGSIAKLRSDRNTNQIKRDAQKQRSSNRYTGSQPDYSQLNRDLHARQRGYQQFNSRRAGGFSGSRAGGMRGRGMGRGRR